MPARSATTSSALPATPAASFLASNAAFSSAFMGLSGSAGSILLVTHSRSLAGMFAAIERSIDPTTSPARPVPW